MPGLVAGRLIGGSIGIDAKALGQVAQPAAEDLATRPNWEARDFVDLNYASRKAEAKRAAKQRAAERATAMAAMQARIVADLGLVQHLIAIKSQLAADEIETLMGAVAGTIEAEQVKFLDAIKALPVEGAVAFCREVIKAIREQPSA
jgi:hypothetical protein|nr:hypothetical protein [Kofleriaceae bacterium]